MYSINQPRNSVGSWQELYIPFSTWSMRTERVKNRKYILLWYHRTERDKWISIPKLVSLIKGVSTYHQILIIFHSPSTFCYGTFTCNVLSGFTTKTLHPRSRFTYKDPTPTHGWRFDRQDAWSITIMSYIVIVVQSVWIVKSLWLRSLISN